MPDFLLPDLGEGLEDAELTAWHVRVGDHVAVNQVVAEVETAKAAVEVPIPFAGTVTAVHAEPGTTLPVGAPLISVTADGPGTGPVGQASGNVLIGYGTRPSRGALVARAGARSPPPRRPPRRPARRPARRPLRRRPAGCRSSHR